MPRKKKRRTDSSQLKISFGTPAAPELCLVQQSTVESEDQDAAATNRRGNLRSWKEFAAAKWLDKYPWLLVKGDGVYCKFCSMHMSVLMGGSATFISEPFTGVRPDKLLQHEKSSSHESASSSYCEQQSRDAAQQLDVIQVMTRANALTVDEEAFADALRCMYYLNKHPYN